MLNMKCNTCDWEGMPNLEETGPHTKALCGKCGKYIKMVSKKELDKLITNEIPPMSKAFTIEVLKGSNICSACFDENPLGIFKRELPMRPNVVSIETSSGGLHLCEHHRKVLIDILKQY